MNDLTYLMEIFPKGYGVRNKLVDRLNKKNLSTAYGNKKYTYQTVYQALKGRWYDENIHEELLLLRDEYLKKKSELKKIEEEQNSLIPA